MQPTKERMKLGVKFILIQLLLVEKKTTSQFCVFHLSRASELEFTNQASKKHILDKR